MGALSDDGAALALDSMLGDDHGPDWPDSVWLALFAGDPTSGGTEVAGGAYARAEIVNDSTNWPAATSRQKSVAVAVTFTTATAGWGTVTHIGLYDAATSGNLLASDMLTTSQSVLSGDAVVIPVGGIVLSL